jgi:hypothetical protein
MLAAKAVDKVRKRAVSQTGLHGSLEFDFHTSAAVQALAP